MTEPSKPAGDAPSILPTHSLVDYRPDATAITAALGLSQARQLPPLPLQPAHPSTPATSHRGQR